MVIPFANLFHRVAEDFNSFPSPHRAVLKIAFIAFIQRAWKCNYNFINYTLGIITKKSYGPPTGYNICSHIFKKGLKIWIKYSSSDALSVQRLRLSPLEKYLPSISQHFEEAHEAKHSVNYTPANYTSLEKTVYMYFVRHLTTLFKVNVLLSDWSPNGTFNKSLTKNENKVKGNKRESSKIVNTPMKYPTSSLCGACERRSRELCYKRASEVSKKACSRRRHCL